MIAVEQAVAGVEVRRRTSGHEMIPMLALLLEHGAVNVKVDYRAKLLMVKEFLTHKEFTLGGWKKWAR